MTIQKEHTEVEVLFFLMADSVTGALQFIEGCTRSNMSELAQWSVEADKVFTF
jgi:sulfur relay (sulfurtransferase) complex TusBCD TusD component (DsrE family)